MSKPLHVAVLWPRFGPYHLARLRRCQAEADRRGHRLTTIETAATDALYEWEATGRSGEFEHERVFESESFHDIAPRRMRQGVIERLDKIAPDVVGIMSYGFPDARAALAWCRRKRCRAVLMTDSRAEDTTRTTWREWIKSAIVRQYDAALVAGSDSTRYLTNLGFESARIFDGYDVVDNAHFARAAAEAGARPRPEALAKLGERPFFLASNRFIERKNLDLLLRAFARYEREVQDPWGLVLLGDGEARPRLEDMATSLNIEGLAMPGWIRPDELGAYYGHASAFVHPALADQWALVVNEAMAARLPIVVSRGTGCAADLVREGVNGYAFDSWDEDGLVRCLTRLSASAAVAQEMGLRGRDMISEWDLDRFAHHLFGAAEVATDLAPRRRHLGVDLLFTLLDRFATRVDSGHTVES